MAILGTGRVVCVSQGLVRESRGRVGERVTAERAEQRAMEPSTSATHPGGGGPSNITNHVWLMVSGNCIRSYL